MNPNPNKEHDNSKCKVPFCEDCLNNIKRLKKEADSLHPNEETPEQELREKLLKLCHKYEDKDFMAVHGKCDMDLAAPRCAKRVKELEKLFATHYKAREAEESVNRLLNIKRMRAKERIKVYHEITENWDKPGFKQYILALYEQDLKMAKAELSKDSKS